MNREKGTGNTIERSDFQLWYEIRLLLLGSKDVRERALVALQDPELKDPAAATKDSELSQIWGDYDRRRTMMCWRRRLFTSKRGFTGLGPDSAQPQDKILILKGVACRSLHVREKSIMSLSEDVTYMVSCTERPWTD